VFDNADDSIHCKIATNEILATYNMCYSMWRLGAIVRPAKKEQEFKYDFLMYILH